MRIRDNALELNYVGGNIAFLLLPKPSLRLLSQFRRVEKFIHHLLFFFRWTRRESNSGPNKPFCKNSLCNKTKNEARSKYRKSFVTFTPLFFHTKKTMKNKSSLPSSLLSLFLTIAIPVAIMFSIFSLSRCGNETVTTEVITDTIQPDTLTRIQIINGSDSSIVVYITLGTVPGTLQNVSLIPFVTDSIGSLVGSFSMGPNDTTIAYAPSTVGFDGNVTFGTQPINCPNTQFPYGTNIFEFNINNSFQVGNPQNTVDISCVAGVNCYLKGYLSGGNPWNASSAFPDVDSIYNSNYTSNSGLVGIFPYGCDTCTGQKSAPTCVTNSNDKQTQSICNVQRNAIGSGGGLIQIVYLGSN